MEVNLLILRSSTLPLINGVICCM